MRPHASPIASTARNGSISPCPTAPMNTRLTGAPTRMKTVVNATGSATRVARLHVLAEPPSIDKGEVTDKGSINQRAVLQHRAALVEALYEGHAADPFLILPNRS